MPLIVPDKGSAELRHRASCSASSEGPSNLQGRGAGLSLAREAGQPPHQLHTSHDFLHGKALANFCAQNSCASGCCMPFHDAFGREKGHALHPLACSGAPHSCATGYCCQGSTDCSHQQKTCLPPLRESFEPREIHVHPPCSGSCCSGHSLTAHAKGACRSFSCQETSHHSHLYCFTRDPCCCIPMCLPARTHALCCCCEHPFF